MRKTTKIFATASLSVLMTLTIAIKPSQARDTASGASAEASFMSGLVILSATVAPLMLFDELSRTNQPLKVEDVQEQGEKSKIKLSSGKEKIELQIDKKTAQTTNIKPGQDVVVDKNNFGYTLNVENKVIGVVSNSNDFKSNKIN